ncbi:MAG: elongation factor G [Candidatus Omnitrophica bacterium]|nr:elongation factor G [Candidatus Omnitrophota bacterium]MDD5488915.1 elongation factor G [Candidatus Omnitrophota bacterium]
MTVSTKDIRNVVLLSHSGAGKTTLLENLLFKGGSISRKGSVDDGTSVSDYNDDEKERKNSINLSVAFYEKDEVKVNVLDAPGYLDYSGEVFAAVNAADAAILMIDSVSGMQVGTTKFWKYAQERNLPALIVISRMDKDNADFDKVFESIKNTLGKNCVAYCYPDGQGPSFKGVANLLTKKGIDALAPGDKAKAETLSGEMTEGVAESDDALLEKYLEEGALSDEDLKRAFRQGVVSGKIMPVIPVSSEKEIGVEGVMDIIKDYFPSPLDAAAAEIEGGEEGALNVVEPKEDAPFSAQVFKTISDPYAGRISIFRIRSGKIATGQSATNTVREGQEKLGQIFFLKGKDQVPADGAVAGDICAVAKLKDTHTGDTLSDEKHVVRFKAIKFPEAAISFSIKPKSRSDEDKISNVLTKLSEEDPTFHMALDEATHELVVSGMGELHLKTVLARMKNKYGVDVEIGTPKVAYKETITGKGDAKYRHKKQSGGAGQFAEVWMKIEPMPRGGGFEFVDEVVGGAIPKQFVGSCEKGVINAMAKGIIAGHPVVDVRVMVYDGKTHPVDSKDIAFQIAAAHAFKECFEQAKPVLLEPVMNVELTVPEENMGDITGSLSSRRGRVQGMDSEGGMQVVKAQLPLEEMYKYANELKSLTGGRATYTMAFSHYDPVPPNIAQKIIAEAKKEWEEQHQH